MHKGYHAHVDTNHERGRPATTPALRLGRQPWRYEYHSQLPLFSQGAQNVRATATSSRGLSRNAVEEMLTHEGPSCSNQLISMCAWKLGACWDLARPISQAP